MPPIAPDPVCDQLVAMALAGTEVLLRDDERFEVVKQARDRLIEAVRLCRRQRDTAMEADKAFSCDEWDASLLAALRGEPCGS